MARCGADEPVELARGRYNKANLVSGMDKARWRIWEDRPTLVPNVPRLHRMHPPLAADVCDAKLAEERCRVTPGLPL